ncbi:SpoIIE family protein phosphatase [Leptospira yasudae]|uniref:SpoIIE family protein phosphatase n=1 Tax=Leptospira yasudae TaxID=2202201 RepID=UPI001C4EF915|nr:SpoIIE family protein phosphatase [Leptospira yasudae]MBW0434767.1 SpoIIE family protein phosphatase [Leptospira yasudae]
MFAKFLGFVLFFLVTTCLPDLQPASREENFQDLSDDWEIQTGQNVWKPVRVPSNLKEFADADFRKFTDEDFHDFTDTKSRDPQGRIGATPILLRKRFSLENSFDGSLSLSLGKISDRATVRWNGKELTEELFSEYQTSVPQGYDRTRIYAIPETNRFKNNEILVTIRPYFDYEFGILSGPIGIGAPSAIWKRFFLGEFTGLIVFGSFSLIGSFFLFLSLREKKGEENFYFGLFLIFFALFQISLSELKYLTGFKILNLKKLEYSSLAFLFPLFCRFLNSLLRKAKTKFHFCLEVLTIPILIAMGAAETVLFLDQINRYALQVSWIGFVCVALRILIPNLKRSFESKIILSGILFLLFCVGIDILAQRGLFKMFRLSGIGVCGFLGFLTLILANKFVRMKEKLKSWNRVLETAIRNRTQKLSSSLEEIRSLKEQQDGDYFLITLLFQPFLSKNLKTSQAQIDIHRKQFKSFQFKNRTYELGGDVVLSETVSISGISYQALINADAMGKSLQGASGALVFCSIVKSFLQTQDYEFRNPENWLFLLYRNLQAVFESFDGSMLVSGILSLYRMETGDLFFLNCEHPPIILVRNGKASYLHEDAVLRKIGFPDPDSKVKVEHFRLQSEDVVLYGSDGREDLYFQNSFDSSRKQKVSSPDLFFDLVQTEIPDLAELEMKIVQKAELSDDLSFLKIQTGAETFLGKNRSLSRSLLQEGYRFYKKGEFQKACLHVARASILDPSDLKLARLVLVLAKKSQSFKLFRFFSEKVLLRTTGQGLAKDSKILASSFRSESSSAPQTNLKTVKKAN